MSKTETQSDALTAERRLFITAVANLELRKKFGDEGFRLDLERDELEALIEMAERASRLDAENKALRSAERTLQRLGYQDHGGHEWAPPIGQAPDFDLIDSLRSRIEALDAESKALRERLEIDPSHPIDGIAARDETIRQLEEMVKSVSAAERERICEAIKTEDDYCVTQGDYMLDSDDCIKVARGEWVRPVYEVDPAPQAAAKNGGAA